MAENNHQRTLALRAPRGILFDRNGKVLVENRHSFTISIVREHTKDLDQTVTAARARGGARPEAGAATSSIVIAASRSYRPIVVVEDATLAQVAAITARRLDFELPDVVSRRGADPQVPASRSPRTCSATSARSATRRWRPTTALKSGDIVGQSGIEKIYNATAEGRGRRARASSSTASGREMSVAAGRAADRRQAAAADDRLRRADGRSRTRSTPSAWRADERGRGGRSRSAYR